MNENYYLSEYELYLLFKEYKVNCLLLVFKNGKKNLPFTKKNVMSTIQDDSELYIIITKNFLKKNTPPEYGLVLDENNNIKLNKNNLKKLVSFAGNMKELDELYADFKKVDDELLKIKRAKKAQEMSRYRNKKKLKKKINLPGK